MDRFGPLRLHNKLQVGKDQRSWQELECYLFSEMLICVKEKKVAEHVAWEDDGQVPRRIKATLKGSIMIKKHLDSVESISGRVRGRTEYAKRRRLLTSDQEKRTF